MTTTFIFVAGGCVCFLFGLLAGQSGMVPKSKYDSIKATSESYRSMWECSRDSRNEYRLKYTKKSNEAEALASAIRESRRSFDAALPPVVTHTVK